jgi:phage recombination protein Bet
MTKELSKSVSIGVDFTQEQVQIIKDGICKGATDNELKYFLNVCKSRGLNPFKAQIYSIPRWDGDLGREVRSIQTSIGGYRSLALGTGQFGGETEAIFFNKDGAEFKVWTSEEAPMACSVGVLKIIGTKTDGSPVTQEFRKIVYWDAVVQKKKDKTPTSRWLGKKGVMQLEKCAAAASLRSAFPEALDGIHTEEEMEHLDGETGAEVRAKSGAAQDFLSMLPPEVIARMEKFGLNNDAKKRTLCQEVGNTLEALELHIRAVEFFGGYRNRPECRRLLVKLGEPQWNQEAISKFLSGEPVLETAP